MHNQPGTEHTRPAAGASPALGRRWLLALLAVLAAGGLALALGSGRAAAQESDQAFDNEYCLGCHAVPSLEVPLPSGETLNAVVDREAFEDSVHGRLELPCVLCHTDIQGFPHPELDASSLRDYSLSHYESCEGCHLDQYTATADNVHSKALEAGNPEAAVCTDCHGSHDVQPVAGHHLEIPLTCRTCHSEVYDLYKDSVHGDALVDGNPDVPTCTDCHGVHNVDGPTDSEFHLFSPQICAECHADKELMGKYGISTEVFNSYVADFHGTTVLLFEELTPDQETNKPVCIDCHGVHHIVPADNPDSTVFKENLLGTCQRCHPDATANFPSAWLSHYQPSSSESPLVFFVTLFYRVAIPLLIGVMILYVLLDLVRGRRLRRRELRHG